MTTDLDIYRAAKDKLTMQTAGAKELKGELKAFDGACLSPGPNTLKSSGKKSAKPLDPAEAKAGGGQEDCRGARLRPKTLESRPYGSLSPLLGIRIAPP
jgi:hypothetical protein